MIDAFFTILKKTLDLLPSWSVVTYLQNAVDSMKLYLGYMNWLIPFGTLADIMGIWLACMGAYYAYVQAKGPVMKMILKLIK